MIIKTKTIQLLLAAFLCFNASFVSASQGSINKYAPSISVASVPLKLNGSGIRYKAIFKVYDLGLYTQTKVRSLAEINLTQPVSLNFIALRDITGTDVGGAFFRSLSNNTSTADLIKHMTDSKRFVEIFSGKPRLLTGDTFAIEYTPGKGTLFYITGVPQGSYVGDETFFRMILKIWVGDIPADIRLKDALLDIAPTTGAI